MGIDAEMFVRTRSGVTKNQVMQWAYELASAFGHERFGVYRDSEWAQHSLELIDVYEQDGPDITPEPGETFIKCNLSTRYYGVDYERGDLPIIIAVAEWLERKIFGAEVWYGGDSSGVLAEPFGKVQRDELFQHFVNFGHEPYRGAMHLGGNIPAPMCEFCEVEMFQTMWSGTNGGGFSCSGCGHRVVTRDSGKTFAVEAAKC